MLDLRWPMGLMFTIVGALMVVYGLWTFSDDKLYTCSLGIRVNLWWGLVLLVFGASMVGLAWRAGRKAKEEKP
jgi:hypothetical protein